MKQQTSAKLVAWLAGLSLVAISGMSQAQVVLTTPGTAVNQNFDSLVNTGTGSTTPTGWAFAETGTNANTTYTASTGSANGGDTYSFGVASATERAFGGLQSGSLVPIVGAQLSNSTGGVLTGLAIAYTGEQWRLGTSARAVPDKLDFQYSLDATSLTTGTWVDVDSLDFIQPFITGTVGALDGNAAANRTAVSSSITGLSVANGSTLWIRWNSFDATGADDGLAIDDVAITPQGSGTALGVSINDVTQVEGNSGTSNFVFTVSLSAPATSTVSVNFATADAGVGASFATAGSDYVATNGTVSFLTGEQSKTVTVVVNGDTTVESNETFNVNLSVPVGLTISDGLGVGTISNDDVVITPISAVQGSGLVSPIANGTTVTIEGIVTGIKTNGYFLQTPDANVDGNAATSEGILLFTGSAPPASVVLGNRLQVTGNVLEFIPSTDLDQPPTTELVAPFTITVVSSGNPLPAPIAISTINAAGSFNQLENLEHMRVSFAGLTAVSGTDGFTNEPNNTGTSNGVFFATLPGVTRPKREPGIDLRDTLLAATPVTVPRFDTNPETLRIDSDALVGAPALNLVSGQNIGPVTGILDYGRRFYTFLIDPTAAPTISPAPGPNSATPAASAEFTVASYNLERFFDTVDDPAVSDPVLTATAFQNRLSKLSRQVRINLANPDIIGVTEVENLTTLQAVATQISTDGGPTYTAFLVEGNDPGGIDVGFLVKTSNVVGSTPRVTVVDVTQLGKTTTFTNPTTGMQDLLNDRPPLQLRATINSATGGTANVTVLINHLRSFLGMNDPVDGARIRAKRLAQAEFVANIVQTRQAADANERIVVIGDFNAYEFNDGYVDVMGSIIGNPALATQVTLPGPDLVNPNMTRLADAAADYSYVFDGFIQSIDHGLVSQGLINNSSARFLEHVRINADFPETGRNDNTSNTRLSDHDAFVIHVAVPSLGTSSSSTLLTSSLNPASFGSSVNLIASVTGNAPTGTVTFVSGATTLGTGTLTGTGNTRSASFATSALPVGSTLIQANYAGDAQNTASSSTTLTQVVNPAASTTAIVSSQNPSMFGSSVTFTANVTGVAPTGTVNFSVGATNIGSGTLSGSGNTRSASFSTTTLPLGTSAIVATYVGDAQNATSSSSALNQVVNPVTSGTTLTSAPNPSRIGQSVTLTAQVTGNNPTGAVSFRNGATVLGSANLTGTGNTRSATFSTTALPVGTASLSASYAGDTNNAASQTTTPVNHVVQAGDTSIVVTANPNPFQIGQPVTLTATVTVTAPAVGPATGSVTFFNFGTAIGSAPLVNGVASLTTTLTSSANISASFVANNSFNGSSSAVIGLTNNTQAVPSMNWLGMLLMISLLIVVGLRAQRQ